MLDTKRFNELTDKLGTIDKIAVVGDVGIDKYTLGAVERISPEAPVPVLSVEREWLKLGLAANVSDNLGALEIPSVLFGVIGDDDHAQAFEELLEDKALSTWGIVRSQKRMTTFKERIVAKTQQICRIDYESKEAVDDTSKNFLFDRLKEFSKDLGGVILEDYGKGLFDRELTSEIIKYFRKEGKVVSVDPSRTSPIEWFKGASLIKPNLKEARILMNQLGRDKTVEPKEMCKILIGELELDHVVVTLGEDGMMSQSKGDTGVNHIPTVARAVFDVSGAGDTSVALLTSSLLAGASINEAAIIANIGAGIVVGKKGTATVTLDELKSEFQNLYN